MKGRARGLLAVFALVGLATAAFAGDEKGGDEQATFDTPPSPIAETIVGPDYPKGEREAGVEGRVLLQTAVTAKGAVAEITVLEGIEEHPAFEEAAIAALRQWRFNPAMLDGKAVTAQVVVPFKFALE